MRTARRQQVQLMDAAQAATLLSLPLEAINKELAERKLAEFTRQMWPTMDPHTYVHNWHIDAISDHAEAVINREILRLIINIPPRHMKSLTISVGLVPWTWLRQPKHQFLYASYAHSLAIRDGVKARRLIDSPLFRGRWNDRFMLTGDQNTKIRYDNDQGGYRICTSVDGTGTGEGGDTLVFDDPNNVRESESETVRDGTNNWFDEAMQSRFNDPKTGALMVIQQRTHSKDVTGHVISKYGNEYTYLILPCKYEVESRRKMTLRTFHGWSGDPRKEEGELLWPERFGEEEVRKLETALGPYAAAGQLQQRPAPREGGLVPIEKFKRYKRVPSRSDFIRLSLVLDTASKEDELHDYSVCELWGETSWGYYLLYVWRKKCQFPSLKRRAIALSNEFCPHEVLIEDKSSGIALIQCMKEETKHSIKGIDPEGLNKVIRMEAESSAIDSGLCYIPETVNADMAWVKYPADWLTEFEEEAVVFPNGDHDDQIDPMSMYLKERRERRQKGPVIAIPVGTEQESQWGALGNDEEDESHDGFGEESHSWRI